MPTCRASGSDQGEDANPVWQYRTPSGELRPQPEEQSRTPSPRSSRCPHREPGIIITQAGNIGWSLYVTGGKLKYCYNLLGIRYFYVESRNVLTPGEHQVRMAFAYAGGGLGKGGTATLYIDGKPEGEGQIAATAPIVFSADDGCDIGQDTGAPVSPDYSPGANAFTGRVKGVQLDISPSSAGGDLVSPEEAVRVAMARQ